MAGAIAVNHGGQLALCGVELHSGPPQQAGQFIEFGRDSKGELFNPEGLQAAQAAEGGTTLCQECFAVLARADDTEFFQLAAELVQQSFSLWTLFPVKAVNNRSTTKS